MERIKKKSNNIIEELNLQPLTEEEKQEKHILGRLYGPIATSQEGTRNGRKYNKELWEKALNDPLMDEKVKNKCLFLELGHPLDGREETLMEKACACIPELPKIDDNGDLIAYIDILDTPNGKILKTLCDYGFVPGISSRGSGDVVGDEVDPESFQLETWDIVQIPAVEKARLHIQESLDENNTKMRQALCESLNKSSAKDKAIMADALDNLGIDIKDEEDKEEMEPSIEKEIEVTEEEPKVELSDEEIKQAKEDPVSFINEYITKTTSDIFKQLGLDYQVEVDSEKDPEEVQTEVKFKVTTPEDEKECDSENCADKDDDVEGNSKPEAEVDETTDEAKDNGSDEMVESLQKTLKTNLTLKADLKKLQEELAVSDTKVKSLNEDLRKYKNTTIRLSDVAEKNKKKLAEEVEKLEGVIDTKSKELIKRTKEVSLLKESIKRYEADKKYLTESINTRKTDSKNLQVAEDEINKLNESLTTTSKKLKTVATELDSTKGKLKESIDNANSYKQLANAVVNKYIDTKALMLGISPQEIKNKLNESYTIKDIDKVCEDLQSYSLNVSKLPFNVDRKVKVQFHESKQNNSPLKQAVTNSDDDISPSLLRLGGLDQ